MLLVARAITVLAAAVAWLVLASWASFAFGLGKVAFPAEEEFSAALSEAQIDAWRDELTGPLPAVCSFPGTEPVASFELSHDEVVTVARCLHRGGHLSSDALRRIEESTFGISAECQDEPATPDAIAADTCSYTYLGARPTGHAWLSFVVALIGLPVVVWIVGFRLPWPRRA